MPSKRKKNKRRMRRVVSCGALSTGVGGIFLLLNHHLKLGFECETLGINFYPFFVKLRAQMKEKQSEKKDEVFLLHFSSVFVLIVRRILSSDYTQIDAFWRFYWSCTRLRVAPAPLKHLKLIK